MISAARDQNKSTNLFAYLFELVESKTRIYHGSVRLGRRTVAAKRRGRAGLGRTGRCSVDLARKQPSLLLSSESWTLS